jgi:Heparinase II/III-like protein/Heparinase II/III N-terminus
VQQPAWYWQRLKRMSVGEIAWRLRALVNDQVDLMRLLAGRIPQLDEVARAGRSPPFRLSRIAVGCWSDSKAIGETERRWCSELLAQAERIRAHRLSYFDLVDVDIGNPIRWQRDHSSGKEGALRPIQHIDYRDFSAVGDCKLVWEPNRHHQLVVLARAYRGSGDRTYARAMLEQLLSWIEQNPFGRGMNWRSPLELGIRLINWVWALDLVREADVIDEPAWRRIRQAVFQHCHDITRKYSRGSSANNHLVGEAAGVFVASSYFDDFPASGKWQRESAAILEREIIAQSFPDGCTREHALGYQFFVMQFYLFTALVAERAGRPFSDAFRARLASMVTFAVKLAAAGGSLPMFGDRDDGCVLDLGDDKYDVRSLTVLAARVLGDSAALDTAGAASQAAFWSFGTAQMPDKTGHSVVSAATLASTAFRDSGYYLLQAQDNAVTASVFVDCAELGYGSIAAHGNADALSLVVRLNGTDLFVDPGTFDYFTFPEWRDYFRSTRAHNTLEIDARDQSEMLGPFLWGRRAAAKCTQWTPLASGGLFEGEHDGYASLPDPVRHARRIVLDGPKQQLVVTDTVESSLTHQARLHFHLGPECRVLSLEHHAATVACADLIVTIDLDDSLTLTSVCGSTDPIMGWYSPGYHQRVPICTLIAEGQAQGRAQWRTAIRWKTQP